MDAGVLPLLVTVGLADACDNHGVRGVEIAWPNDIFAGGGKVAGSLC